MWRKIIGNKLRGIRRIQCRLQHELYGCAATAVPGPRHGRQTDAERGGKARARRGDTTHRECRWIQVELRPLSHAPVPFAGYLLLVDCILGTAAIPCR